MARRSLWLRMIGMFVLMIVLMGFPIGVAMYALSSIDWAGAARDAGGIVREFNKGVEER